MRTPGVSRRTGGKLAIKGPDCLATRQALDPKRRGSISMPILRSRKQRSLS